MNNAEEFLMSFKQLDKFEREQIIDFFNRVTISKINQLKKFADSIIDSAAGILPETYDEDLEEYWNWCIKLQKKYENKETESSD